MSGTVHLARSLPVVYVVLALVALPVIVFGLGFHISGADCSDGSWAESVTLAERDGIYRALGDRVRIGLLVVAFAGVVCLGLVFFGDHAVGGSKRAVPAALIAGVLVLYALAYMFSLWWFRCIDGTFSG